VGKGEKSTWKKVVSVGKGKKVFGSLGEEEATFGSRQRNSPYEGEYLDSRSNKSFLKRSDLKKKKEGEREKKVRLGGRGKMCVILSRTNSAATMTSAKWPGSM
jgi:hypothetical protein